MTKATKKHESQDAIPTEPQLGEMLKIKIIFRDITPLIQHNAKGMRSEEPVEGLNKKTKEHLSGKAEAIAGLYRTSNGHFYHPADAFRDSMIEASVGSKIGKRSSADVLMSGLFTLHDEAILVDPKTLEPFEDDKDNAPWIVDTRTVVNPTTGGRLERSRPRWEKWATIIEFEYDPFTLNEKVIMQTAQLAGLRVGVGQLRPCPKKKNPKRGRGGRYGKFTPELVKL